MRRHRTDAHAELLIMGLLAGKKILITGVLSNRSIAYGVARACRREGAELAFTYVNDELKERVLRLASEFGAVPVKRCDVTKDDDIANLFDALAETWGGLDGLLHSIAFAPREALAGDYLDTLSRESFAIAHDVSSYSFAALAKGARPLMKGRGGSLVTLTYLGAIRSVPNYNVMGLAKASLEANVRYLAASLGPENIRVNAVSAGPIKTLAAAGIGNFGKLLSRFEKAAPLRRNVTIDEVGNVVAFYFSDLSSAITGEITYVDCGFSTVALGAEE
jgi:enoyl-[acyl-carrier protein] reductase I